MSTYRAVIPACREILSADPTARVLFLTSYSNEEAVQSTILAGAAGYVLKEIRQDALIHAIETVSSGQSILDPKVTQTVLATPDPFERAVGGKRERGDAG